MTKLAWFISAFLVATTASAQATKPDWRPLFNGKDLSGWSTFLMGEGKDHDATHVFRLDADGVLHLYKDETAKPPIGYIATTQEFSDYHLRFQYKWGRPRAGAKPGARRNSGLLYHIHGPDGARLPAVVWPFCVQCQVQEQVSGEIVALGTSVSTTIDPAKKEKPTFKDASDAGLPFTSPQSNDPKLEAKIARAPSAKEIEGDWNTVEVIVRGDTATHILNGQVTARITGVTTPNLEDKSAPWVALTKGRIGFQGEGYEVLFRNVEIQPLSDASASTSPPTSK